MDELTLMLTGITVITFIIALYNFLRSYRKEGVTDEQALQKVKDECMAKSQSIEVKLASLESKYNTMFDVILTKFPKLLVSPHTPELDALMNKGLKVGWECLSASEASLFNELIDKEITVEELDVLHTTYKGTSPKVNMEKTAARISAFTMLKEAVQIRRAEKAC